MTKACNRRARDLAFTQTYFVGRGIDIGAGGDPMGAHKDLFPLITEMDAWDLDQGDAQELDGLEPESYDLLVSSHALEHLADPVLALRRWLQVVKPGGYVVITVPDWGMYEKFRWPSQFGEGHLHRFCMVPADIAGDGPGRGMRRPQLHAITDVLRELTASGMEFDLERLMMVRDHFVPGDLRDQTMVGDSECAIELVLRRM